MNTAIATMVRSAAPIAQYAAREVGRAMLQTAATIAVTAAATALANATIKVAERATDRWFAKDSQAIVPPSAPVPAIVVKPAASPMSAEQIDHALTVCEQALDGIEDRAA